MSRYELVSNVLLGLIPDDAEWGFLQYLGFWARALEHEWREGNIELLLRVPGQALPQAIPCLGRKLTFERDDNTRFIRCVIRSDRLDHDKFEDPFISYRQVDYLKCKYTLETQGEDKTEGNDESVTYPGSNATSEEKDTSTTHPDNDANSKQGRRAAVDGAVQEDVKAAPSASQPVPKLTAAQLRKLSPEEEKERHKQARNYRKPAIELIIAEGKEPTKNHYTEDVFVNDLMERCGLHNSEEVRGFHRTTVRKIFNSLKN